MSYARVVSFEYRPNVTTPINVQKVKNGLLPLFQKTPGFLSYCLVYETSDRGIAIGTWQTREQAESATRQAAQWIAENAGDIFARFDTFVGEVAAEYSASITGVGRAEAPRPEVRH